MTSLRIAALAAAALLAGGCGSDEEDKKAVETTVRAYFNAFAAADGARACEELSTAARNRFTEASAAPDCPSAIRKAREDPRVKRYLPDLASVEVESVRIEGEKATAEVRGLGASTAVPLVKEGDSWKIEGATVASGA